MNIERTLINRRVLLGIIAGSVVLPGIARAVPLPPPAPQRIHLVNAHTNEVFDGVYRNEDGPIPSVMTDLSGFFRDFHADKTHVMDVAVLDFLASVMAASGQTSATILSAYRTPETNEMLSKTTFGVAENSQHLYGRALDVYFENDLEKAMQTARQMQRGGVGWYPHSHFMHIDSGPMRNWNLDEPGLGSLLMAGRRWHFNTKGELVSEGRGRGVTVFRGRVASVRQRLQRLHQLARAEFLQRRHIVR
ncbi:MAG TPA: DUF882 domain-containing protein [Stellaceae bacterium]|jgi:uncharacterized protein YcbK (DUF882 family)